MSDKTTEVTAALQVVPLLEITDSMQELGYFDAAKAAISAFVAAVGPNAAFAIVAYGDEAKPIFPRRGLVPWNDSNVGEATSLVMQAVADNELVNWSAAIERGAKALGKPAGRQGMLFLLSDGIWNTGTDPMLDLPPGVTIYTFALGDNGQMDALRAIALATGGTFTLINEAGTIGTVLIDLLEEIGAGTILSNTVRAVSPSRPLTMVPTVQPDTTSLRVILTWPDPNVEYSAEPKENCLSVSIKDPVEPYAARLLFTTAGYAIFDIETPQPGSWNVEVTFGGPASVTVNLSAIATKSSTTEPSR